MMMLRRREDILLKSGREIELMRAAGAVVAETLARAAAACRAGMTTRELDGIAFETYSSMGAEGLFLGYPEYKKGKGFPRNTCISINEEVVHGIPGDRIIREGDLVSIDCGVKVEGWCADGATTVMVGEVGEAKRALARTTAEVLRMAITLMHPGERWSRIARAMESEATRRGYGVIKEYVGHGIGRVLHEPPRVPNYVSMDSMREDFRLEAGMVLAIEPMLTLGSGRTTALEDGWTVVTVDRQPAAHEEHTVAVTRTETDVLTARREATG